MPNPGGLGEYALGGMADADSLSVPDPLAGLLANPLLQREYLLRANPIDAFNGIAFNGLTTNIGSNTVVSPAGAMTVEAWAYCTGPTPGGTTSVAQIIVSFRNGSTNARELFINGSLQPAFQARNDAGTIYVVPALVSIPLNRWTHIAGVVDVANNVIRIIVNGVEAATAVATTGTFNNQLTGIGVGKQKDTSSFYWNGRLGGDIRVWNTARTAAQILASMNTHLLGTESGLVDCWPLNNASGTSASDIVNAANSLSFGASPATIWSPSLPHPPVTAPVDLSSSGYVSKVTDSPFKHFPPALAKPTDFSVQLPVPALSGSTTVSLGAAQANNADRARTRDALEDWLGCDIAIYMGTKDDSLSNFTMISKGVGNGISRQSDSFTVLYRDAKFRLQRPLQQNKYGGFGAALRFDGAATKVATTLTSPAGSLTMMAWGRIVTSAVDHTVISWRNGTTNLRRLRLTPNAGKIFPLCDARNDAGTLYTLDSRNLGSSYGFAVGTRIHVCMVLDAAALVQYLYVNGQLWMSQLVTGTFNNTIANFTMGVESDASSNWFNGDIDEVAVFNAALDGATVASLYSAPLTGAESNLIGLWHYDEGSGTTVADSAASPHNGTVTLGSGKWVGSLEGGPELQGKPKPLLYGRRRQCAPVLIDAQNGVYQVHDGPINAIIAWKDKGDPVTFGSFVTDIYANQPALNTYDVCKASGLVRMRNAPVGTITFDGEGDTGGVGYRDAASDIAKKILAQLFAWSAIDTAAFNALYALDSATSGFYWTSEITGDAALSEVFQSIWAWWSPDRVGNVTCGRIPDPSAATPSVIVGTSDPTEPTKGGIYADDPVSVRVGEVRVLYKPYQVTMTKDQLAGAVATVKEVADYQQQYRIARAVDPNRTADSDVLEIKSNYDSYAPAYALASYILGILKTDRRLVKRSFGAGLLSYFIGTVMQLTEVSGSVTLVRNLVVVRLGESYGTNNQPDKVEVDLFG